jgi:hypothetical protein
VRCRSRRPARRSAGPSGGTSGGTCGYTPPFHTRGVHIRPPFPHVPTRDVRMHVPLSTRGTCGYAARLPPREGCPASRHRPLSECLRRAERPLMPDATRHTQAHGPAQARLRRATQCALRLLRPRHAPPTGCAARACVAARAPSVPAPAPPLPRRVHGPRGWRTERRECTTPTQQARPSCPTGRFRLGSLGDGRGGQDGLSWGVMACEARARCREGRRVRRRTPVRFTGENWGGESPPWRRGAAPTGRICPLGLLWRARR